MEVYRNSRVYKNLRTPYYLISVRISMKRSVAAAIVGTVFVLMLLPSNIQLQTSNASSLKIVPSDYPSIQSAIDAASPGDTIKVLPGTYNEQLTISKGLTLVGTGSEITIIKAPAKLDTNTNGDPYIVDLKNRATVNIKGLTVSGPSLASCPHDLIGISVMSGATLNLNFASIKDCTYKGIFAEGHAIVKWTTVTDYRDHGIFGFGEDSTIKVSYSSTVAAQNSVIPGQIGVLLDGGANGVIDHNKVSLNSVAGAVAKLTTTP